jgi:hypothetical protein
VRVIATADLDASRTTFGVEAADTQMALARSVRPPFGIRQVLTGSNLSYGYRFGVSKVYIRRHSTNVSTLLRVTPNGWSV